MRIGFLLWIFIPGLLVAQGKKIKTITTTSEVIQATVDRAGDFYVILKTGEIQKYDKQGDFINAFKHNGMPALFDPTNAIRLLVYYQKPAEYTWLSPNLEEVFPFQKIDPSFAIEPALLCPSGERDLWILDASDFSMKKVNQHAGPTKVNPITGRNESIGHAAEHVLQDASITNEFVIKSDRIPSAGAVTSIREYQNALFLFDQKHGIAVYNNVGKLIRFIEVSNLSGYNFLGEELYFLEDGKIKFLDMFTGEKSELPLKYKADFVVLTDERMILTKNDQIDVYEFQPLK